MNSAVRTMFRPMCKPGVVFLAAVVIHAATVVFFGDWRHPRWVEDGALATSIYEGRGFGLAPKAEQRFFAPEAKRRAEERARSGRDIPFSEFHPTSLHAPGYAALLCAVWKVAGRDPYGHLTMMLIQALFVSSMVFPLRALAARWFGPGAAVWAMWLVAVAPVPAYYSARLLSVGIFIPMHPWLLRAWVWLKDGPSPAKSLAVGALTGLAGLFQPMLLGLFGLVGLGALAAAARRSAREAGIVALAAVATLVVILPWTLRNYRVQGELMLIRSGAGPFWIGNNPHATGAAVIEGGAEDLYIAHPPRCISQGTELTEAEYHRALRREAVDHIKTAPAAFLERTMKKIGWFWTWVPRSYAANRPGETAAIRFRALFIAAWMALALAALAGRFLSGPFPREYFMVICIYVGVFSAVYGLLHVGQARFRIEAEYIFIPAAAQGLVALWSFLRGRTTREGVARSQPE
ncbi:MAG: hypothetical protein HY343_00990 [Lentisphaerae bacterium]|nr:hypothetical protein [Lentisphaerota bacterium]